MNSSNETPKAGVAVTGLLKGYYEVKNGEYTNRFLAVVTHDYVDRYGETKEHVQEIDVGPRLAQYAASEANKLIGRPVRVWVGQNCRYGQKNGKAWGFISTFLLNGQVIESLDSLPAKSKAA